MLLLPPLSDRPWEQRDARTLLENAGDMAFLLFLWYVRHSTTTPRLYTPGIIDPLKLWKEGDESLGGILLYCWIDSLKKKVFFFLCFFLFLWRVALGSLHKFPHRLIAIDRSSQFRWVAGNVIVRREKPPVVDCQHLFCFILWRLRNRLIVNNLLFRQPSCYPNWFSFLSPSKKSSFLRSSSKVANSPSLVLSRAFLFLFFFSSRQVLLLCCNERRERL